MLTTNNNTTLGERSWLSAVVTGVNWRLGISSCWNLPLHGHSTTCGISQQVDGSPCWLLG